ncbi:MAG: rfbF [Hyphomicrobiales bacterium]|nr:rfbF [Hyphomicrobiales bacterium]
MKAVILAGGLGTRLAEETSVRPKPMVEIGGKPILWHIMKIYAAQGVTEFVVCLGYKGYCIKEFFANYFLHVSDVTFDLAQNRVEVHRRAAEPWRVTLVDTGERTQTGGRLKRVRDHLAGEDVFALTYGDGLADLDLAAERRFHAEHGRLATVCAVRPGSRFGALDMEGDRVARFQEKPQDEGGWINGGFFLLSPAIFDRIEGDDTVLEREPLEKLAAQGELRAYRHRGFWQPMDTLRDKNVLEDLWSSGAPPWRMW